MNRMVALIAAMLLVGFVCPASATTVEVVKGIVSVSQGDGFRQVTGSTTVSNGSKVMAAPGGMARIVYPDGCVVPVGPGGVATVGVCKQPMTAGLEEVPQETHPRYLLLGGIAVGIGVGICAAQGCFREESKPHGHSP